MANHLQMSQVQAIITLLERQKSARAIAELLAVDKKTVLRYKKRWERGELVGQKGPHVPTGSEADSEQKGPEVPTGSGRSLATEFHEIIKTKLACGQHAKSVHYDLLREHGYLGSYDSVKRYARKLKRETPELVTRLYYPPGDAAQVDFGQGAKVKGEKRRPHLFVLTLCASRKAYREVVWDQKTDTFLGCLQHGFEHFGGVPLTLILDNLKAAVLKAIWADPLLNRKFELFCKHYGIVPLPCHAASPKEKGLIENGVKYGQGMLQGREFDSLLAQNQFLLEWDERVANTRIHGTTKRQVQAAFAEEKPHLRALPTEPFAYPAVQFRRVHMDGRIEVEKGYYPVPEQYLGQKVEVRYVIGKLVRVYDQAGQEIVVHQWVTKGKTAPVNFAQARQIPASRQEFEAYVLKQIATLGPEARAYAEAAITRRGPMAYRFLQSFKQLGKKHGVTALKAAIAIAARRGVYAYAPFALLCEREAAQHKLTFALSQEHEIIRPLQDYKQILETS